MSRINITYSTHKAVESFDENEYVKVISNKDYLNSRLCINKLKAGLYENDLNIVVGNSKFKSGYEDLIDIGDFVKFKEFSMKNLIKEKLAIKIPKYISEYDIVEVFNSTDKLDEFMKSYDFDYTFEENLAVNIMNLDSLSFIGGQDSIIKLLNDECELFISIDNTDLPKATVINVINNKSDHFDLKNDFIEIMGEHNGFNLLLEKIIHSMVLMDYKDTDRKILGYEKTYPKESLNDLEDCFIKSILDKNRELIQSINKKVKIEHDKLTLFSPSVDLEYFIDNISGLMNFELEFFMDKFKGELYEIDQDDKLKALYSTLDRAKNKFSFILENDDLNEDVLNDLLDLTDRLSQIARYEENFYEIEEWWDFYRQKYVKNFNTLSLNEDIYKLIERVNLDKELENKIKGIVKEKELIVNKNYEKFLIENYKDFISTTNNKTVSSRIHSLREIDKDKKIIFIVIDAMRWSIWEVIRTIFEKYNYESVDHNNVTLSMIPSVTSVSRLSLFAGSNYKNLVSQKLSNHYGYAIGDEEKHMKRYFDDKFVAFKSGGKQSFQDLMQEDADIYSFIYTDVDNIFHGLVDINENIIAGIFEEQVKNFVREIENKFSEDEYKIVLATDHGSTDTTNQNKIGSDGNLEKYLEDRDIKHSRHGKYYRIYSKNKVNESEYLEILNYFEEDEQKKCWHVISQEKMKGFALPVEDTDGENLFWIISKYPYYVSQRSGSNIHGGLSMDETIIPFVIMEKNKSSIKELEIFIDGDLEVNKASDLNIEISNPNNINIENVLIASKELELNYRINNILPKSKMEISYGLKLKTVGNINSNFTITYLARGEEKTQKINKNIKVKETSSDKISNKVNKSRSLDF